MASLSGRGHVEQQLIAVSRPDALGADREAGERLHLTGRIDRGTGLDRLHRRDLVEFDCDDCSRVIGCQCDGRRSPELVRERDTGGRR